MRRPLLGILFTIIPLAASLAQTPAAPAQNGKMPPGHPSLDQLQTAPKVEMKHTGTVQETLAASPYIYIRVKEGAADQWLAAPAVDLKAGATIHWPDGMVMKNFFSKTLNRSFETVYFVQAVEVAGAK